MFSQSGLSDEDWRDGFKEDEEDDDNDWDEDWQKEDD